MPTLFTHDLNNFSSITWLAHTLYSILVNFRRTNYGQTWVRFPAVIHPCCQLANKWLQPHWFGEKKWQIFWEVPQYLPGHQRNFCAVIYLQLLQTILSKLSQAPSLVIMRTHCTYVHNIGSSPFCQHGVSLFWDLRCHAWCGHFCSHRMLNCSY